MCLIARQGDEQALHAVLSNFSAHSSSSSDTARSLRYASTEANPVLPLLRKLVPKTLDDCKELVSFLLIS